MKFCGPKLSLCCTILSVWGIIQLGIMGILFYIKSPAFLEDLFIPENATEPAAYIDAMEKSFSQIALNCWIATALYGGTFVLSGWQMWLNFKK
ncbi:ribonuclease kappa-B [Hyalella azteca]|uniref:Ribonuclease kappa-B n=1 Tax=Hyalella azteca TaxID=294128 RepID=A0A8B7PEM6_HYAAZ|nr:ribonuclease kappa-B [Hyalella azteca]